MLECISSFFTRNKKNIIWFCAFLMLFFLDFDISLAAEKSKGEEAIEIINALMKVIAGVIGIMTAFISLFLQPEWVNGTFIELDRYMREIWILVSNVVYIIFAFLLIFIAFANIVNKGGDKFGLKQALPKFIVGVLMVPFSWFAVQFMISLAGVLTVGALSLPYNTFEDRAADFPVFSITAEDAESQSLADAQVCVKYVIHFGNTPTYTTGLDENGQITTEEIRSAEENAKDPIYCKEDGYVSVIQILRGDVIDGKESIYSIISLYTFGLLGLETLDNIDGEHLSAGAVTNIVAFITKNAISLIFLLVFFILLIALFFALFIRILRIWIYIMLSPLFGLMYFFGKTTDSGFSNFNIKEFFALVMTPVYVSLALSFGFMFMLVAGNGLKDQAEVTDETVVAPIQLGIMEIEITGAVNDSGSGLADGTENYIGVALRSFRGLGGALGNVIVLLFGIGMFWLAVMAALRQSEITGAIVKPIADFGAQVGKLAASAPMYAPIIPTGKGMTSAAGIGEVSRKSFAAANNYKVEQGKKLGDQFGLFQTGGAAQITSASQTAINNTAGLKANTNEYANNVNDAVFSGKTTDELSNNTKHLELINKTLKDIGVDLEVTLGDKIKLSEAYREIDAYQEKYTPDSQLFRNIKSTDKSKLDYREIDNALQGNQTSNQAIVKITEGVNFANINKTNISEDNEDFITLKENIQANDKGKYNARDIRKILSEEITDNKIVSAIIKELDKTVVFKGEQSDASDSE